ncbi:MAG: hypothetical protein JJE52_08890 [Acidimicrobiia bacterium]|nr:hypothetical protein [Acidimicrobiia bacterium]
MTDLTADTRAEAHTTLDDLVGAMLPPSTWDRLPGQLRDLGRAFDAGDEHAVRAALVPLSRAVFEAKVRTRLGQRRPGANVVIPTKKTPALPAVGAVCGGLLMLLGWQLGGGLMLAATAGLALLVLGVAVAGTHTNAERATARQASRGGDDEPERAPAPAVVRELIDNLRQRHTPAG